MIRELFIAGIAIAGSVALIDRGEDGRIVTDTFEQGIGRGWAARQEIEGSLGTAVAPGRVGRALLARTGPRIGRVPKAALIARPAPFRTGDEVKVAFDLYAPATTPLDSLQLVDLECATCGEAGNPGIRLYLRRGRLRIDRSKIGIKHAWTRESAPVLRPQRWQHIEFSVLIGDQGAARVALDGREVLTGSGATILPGADHADRVQIGITANSNAVPAALLIDNVSISARRRRS